MRSVFLKILLEVVLFFGYDGVLNLHVQVVALWSFSYYVFASQEYTKVEHEKTGFLGSSLYKIADSFNNYRKVPLLQIFLSWCSRL